MSQAKLEVGDCWEESLSKKLIKPSSGRCHRVALVEFSLVGKAARNVASTGRSIVLAHSPNVKIEVLQKKTGTPASWPDRSS